MRITFSMTHSRTVRDINGKSEDIDRLSSMLSSGQRMLSQSDDPLAWARSMDFKGSLRELDAFNKNIDFAMAWNDATENSLTGVADLVVQVKGYGMQAMSVSFPANQRALVGSINQAIKEAVQLANSRYMGRYVFSGQATSTAPFSITEDANGNVTAISAYQGDDGNLTVRVGKDSHETVNMNGGTAFANPEANVLQTLLAMKNAIEAGDTAGVQTQMDALDKAHQHLTNVTAELGTRVAALDHRKEMLAAIKLNDQKGLSELADADMVETIMQLKQKQTAFEAALQVTSMLKDLNLLQFL